MRSDDHDDLFAALEVEMAEAVAVDYAIRYGVILGRFPDGSHQWMLLREGGRPSAEAWAAIEANADAILSSRTYRRWLSLHPEALRAFVVLWGVQPPAEQYEPPC